MRTRTALSISAVAMLCMAFTDHCDGIRPPRDGRALRAAACTRVITPVVGVNHSDPIYMAGFDNDRQATGVHDDLWARGVVLDSGDKKVAIVSVDLVGYFNNEIETVRSLIDPGRGIDLVVVTSTHNHEGPDTMGLWGPDEATTGVDLGYLDFVNDQIAACIEEADDALAPAALKVVTGSSEGTSLEPWPDLVADGKVLEEVTVDLTPVGKGVVTTQADPGPILNTTVPVLQLRRFRSREERVQQLVDWIADPYGAPGPDVRPLGDVIATLVNFASHPESMGSSNTLITADYPYGLREALEARYGGVAIHVAGDLGVLQGPLDVDIEDPNTGQPMARRTFEFAQHMGELLADRAIFGLQSSHRWDAGPEIDCERDAFKLLIENPFFIAVSRLGVFGRRTVPSQGQPPEIDTEVSVLRIGDAAVVVTPNELDPQIGDTYRDRIGEGPHKFLIGLGNDAIGYQMPEAGFNPSCFECFLWEVIGDVNDCPFIATRDCSTTMQNNVGPGADPLLRGRLDALIDQLYP